MVCVIDGSLKYFSEGGAYVAVGVQEVIPCLQFSFFGFLVGIGMAVVGTIISFPTSSGSCHLVVEYNALADGVIMYPEVPSYGWSLCSIFPRHYWISWDNFHSVRKVGRPGTWTTDRRVALIASTEYVTILFGMGGGGACF